MVSQTGLEAELLAYYDPKKCKARVHAEVQMLERFYQRRLIFVDGDRFLACSKPAYLCCKLYFCYHPMGCVQPDSHEKAYSFCLAAGTTQVGLTSETS